MSILPILHFWKLTALLLFLKYINFLKKQDRFSFLALSRTTPNRGQDYLTQGCIPEERMIYVEAQEDITLDIMMASHMVCLWDVMPLV